MSYGKLKRWYRSRQKQIIIMILVICFVLYYISLNAINRELIPYLGITRRVDATFAQGASTVHVKRLTHVPQVAYTAQPNLKMRQSIIEYIERRLEQALKQDKGSGCDIPKIDPFAKEVMQFEKEITKVSCQGQDWVRCYYSKCKVVPEILNTTEDIKCVYTDIIYENDFKYNFGAPTTISGTESYELNKSDHVKVSCTGRQIDSDFPTKWQGHSLGFRSSVQPKPSEGDPINVLIIAFDSTSKNGFIRRMPRSYKVLTERLGATVLNGYNIVGDGTPAALFPILTGQTELELPEARRNMKNKEKFDSGAFIFDKVKEYGYRTAYFEDMPWIGTFQYRFNGFNRQPADHYLRAFCMEESHSGSKWRNPKTRYCIGDTPRYRLMLNITQQFLNLDAKRFCFTFISDITHDDFNMISTADNDFERFLLDFYKTRTEDTLLMVMGDHGPRYANVRDTLQGKLEERLPLMGIRLPNYIVRNKPQLQDNLRRNADVLTTPHDIYHTVLDVLGLKNFWNPYKVKGADLTRGLSLLEPITKNRSCSEAGIEPHWCTCLSWESLSESDPLHAKTAKALVDFINSLTESVRSKCVVRTLKSVSWVMRARANSGVLTFQGAKDVDGYVGKFGREIKLTQQNYQVKLAVGPGHGVYEASMIYLVNEDKFQIDARDISRTNAYNDEPSCISATLPALNMYCYCNG